MDGQIWLFATGLSEESDWEEAMRESRKPSRPCLDWPSHEVLLEARRLRSRMLRQWVVEAISRLQRRKPSRVHDSRERGAT
ncbi:MAG: hypothetical protein ISP45_18790 [Reyranella sp.]|nr:hypothetical protein [Reyranella sp.]